MPTELKKALGTLPVKEPVLLETDTGVVKHCNYQGMFSHGLRCLTIQSKICRIETLDLSCRLYTPYPSIVSECVIVKVRGYGIGNVSAMRYVCKQRGSIWSGMQT